jgi:hypothetical protein
LLENLKLGLLVVLLLPGFIFVQAQEHHLLREKKPQFEKTLEIILESCLIWIVALTSPFWWPWPQARDQVRNELVSLANTQFGGGHTTPPHLVAGHDLVILAEFFFAVCLWSLIIANIWGIIRKDARIDAAFVFLTGRSWYPAVTLEFFKRSLSKAVVVETKDEARYMGILASAPDTIEGKYIILRSVAFLPKPEPGKDSNVESLPLVEEMLLNIDGVALVQRLKPEILKQKGSDNVHQTP